MTEEIQEKFNFIEPTYKKTHFSAYIQYYKSNLNGGIIRAYM